MKSMKLIKVVVVLAVFLGTYALKDFTQFTDNVYAACRMVGNTQICDEPGSHEHATDGSKVEGSTKTEPKAGDKDEEIKRTEIVGDTATVTCGKDTPDSKIDDLVTKLQAAGVVSIFVKKEGGKKASEKGKKKQNEEDYELSAADEDDYILAKAWDEVLAMLRGNPMYAKDFDNPDLSESLEERIDARIERQVEKFVEAYVEETIKRLTKTQAVNLLDDEDEPPMRSLQKSIMNWQIKGMR
ncbi:MAG: hypothetical protein HYY61_02695 [Deltaproteobacteria bacterium]|nr:hypothetical protein [Deltaproteobacteria bacterium]